MSTRLKKRRVRRHADSTIALINVVFLLLIFFLVAGTLTKGLNEDLRLIAFKVSAPSLPEDVLEIHQDGELVRGAKSLQRAEIVPTHDETKLRVAPDQNLDARVFAQTLQGLRDQGWQHIVVFGERRE